MSIVDARGIAPTFFAIIDAVAHMQDAFERKGNKADMNLAVDSKTFATITKEMAMIDPGILNVYTPGATTRAEGALKEFVVFGTCKVFTRIKETYVYDYRKDLKGK